MSMTQTQNTASRTGLDYDTQFILTQVTDEGLCERIVKRARVTGDVEASAVRTEWRAAMRGNPDRGSDRIHCREA